MHLISSLASSQGALATRAIAKQYGVPVILHTDHCQRSWLPWFDGLMDANEEYFKKNGTVALTRPRPWTPRPRPWAPTPCHPCRPCPCPCRFHTQLTSSFAPCAGEPLFSSHMLDLSEEPLEENVGTCVEYLTRMAKSDILLEMELGVTGGEEDGVDNSDVDSSKLYTQPEEVYEVYTALNAVKGGRFTIAAAFGNVHGVYSPGNVQLTPDILHNCQKYIKEKDSCEAEKPATFVFHGTAQPPTPLQLGIAARRPLPRPLLLALAPPRPLPPPLTSPPRVCVCRRLRLEPRGHPLRDRGGHRQDEH